MCCCHFVLCFLSYDLSFYLLSCFHAVAFLSFSCHFITSTTICQDLCFLSYYLLIFSLTFGWADFKADCPFFGEGEAVIVSCHFLLLVIPFPVTKPFGLISLFCSAYCLYTTFTMPGPMLKPAATCTYLVACSSGR